MARKLGRRYKGGLLLRRSYIEVVLYQRGLLSIWFISRWYYVEWSYIKAFLYPYSIEVVLYRGDLISMLTYIKVVLYRGSLISKWSLMEWSNIDVVLNRDELHRGCLISKWSYIEMTSYRGGLISNWSYIEVALY